MKFSLIVNIISTIFIFVSWSFWLKTYVFLDYKIEGDYIIHKKYGKYPKEVSFKKGMTIYPQQRAIAEIRRAEVGKKYDIDEQGNMKEIL